ncbi:unnamed protein product [Enterobius vermicularis]|uniref:SAM domain-containing protein n=1 Tax=Enterobius vermicularis TaxID=51028 RepID=A0A0N4V2M4_ENTVE|nr:unnamed protein product [Enterobius vermicularis]
MDRELIRKNCRCARNIFELFKPIGMEDVCKYFIAVKITQLNALSQMNERDLRSLGLKTGPRKKIIEVIRILKDELPNIKLNRKDSGIGSSYGKEENIQRPCNAASEQDLFYKKAQRELEHCQKELAELRLQVARAQREVKRKKEIFDTIGETAELVAGLQVRCRQKRVSMEVQYHVNELFGLFSLIHDSLAPGTEETTNSETESKETYAKKDVRQEPLPLKTQEELRNRECSRQDEDSNKERVFYSNYYTPSPNARGEFIFDFGGRNARMLSSLMLFEKKVYLNFLVTPTRSRWKNESQLACSPSQKYSHVRQLDPPYHYHGGGFRAGGENCNVAGPSHLAQVVPMVCQARQINASPVHDTRARFPHCTVYSPTGTSSPVKGIGMRFRTPNMVYPSHPCSPVNGHFATDEVNRTFAGFSPYHCAQQTEFCYYTPMGPCGQFTNNSGIPFPRLPYPDRIACRPYQH